MADRPLRYPQNLNLYQSQRNGRSQRGLGDHRDESPLAVGREIKNSKITTDNNTPDKTIISKITFEYAHHDWVLSHWAHFTVLRFIFVYVYFVFIVCIRL